MVPVPKNIQFSLKLKTVRVFHTSPAIAAAWKSSGIIIDPFVYIPSDKKKSLFTKEGWGQKRTEWKGHWKSGISAAIIQKHCPDFKPKLFPPIANDCFSKFTAAHAKASFSDLMMVTTESMYQNLKQSLAQQQQQGGKNKGKIREASQGRLGFELLGWESPTLVLQMRHFFQAGRGWGQVTCELHPNRRPVLIPWTKANKVIIPEGEDDVKCISNTSICVYEISFQDPQKQWKLASIQEIGTPSVKLQ
mmetsp:Transcript_10726/g.13922  ORF Transcript_10726/g.13922 Transcript_10726/m.13922 type:complete len:248 (-) Transcript_10726:170-913(-)